MKLFIVEVVVVVALLFASQQANGEGNIQRKTSSISRSSHQRDGETYAPGDLIFEDNFDILNSSIWSHEVNMNGGSNGEFQIYDRFDENAYIKGGVLHIKPTFTLDRFNGNTEKLFNGYHYLECCTPLLDPPSGEGCDRQASYPNILPPVISARLRSKGGFSFKYGKIEVRAQLPASDWSWPAIWMMPEVWPEAGYGGWPACGEIDIMESRGNRQLFNAAGTQNIGTEQIGSTMHFGPYRGLNGYWAAHQTRNSFPGNGYDRDFHLYQVEWTDTFIRFDVDNVTLLSVRPGPGGFFELGQFPDDAPNPWVNSSNPIMAPFDQNFHFILNVAVGGFFFPSDSIPPRPWGNQQEYLSFWESRSTWNASWVGDDAAMKIDYIRVWAV